MPRIYFIAGNWKMYKSVAESVQFLRELEAHEELFLPGVEVALFPPFTSLEAVHREARRVRVGAQNLFPANEGAYTGEVSPIMLKGLASHVLVGHSERRHIFHEDDVAVNRKLKAALAAALCPVLCIGETLEEREGGRTIECLAQQLERGMSDLPARDPRDAAAIILAYEPVWAIGTGRNATPEQAQEVHGFLRGWMQRRDPELAKCRLLYGGSVKPENCSDLLSLPDVDGLLIGGASLKVASFSAIISSAGKLSQQ